MDHDSEIVSLTSSLIAAVVPRRRTILREGQPAHAGAAQARGATVSCLCDIQGKILFVTPNAREVLGDACERAAEFGLSLGALLQPEDPEDVDRLIQQFLRTNPDQRVSVELLTRAPSGAARWLDVWCRNLTHDAALPALLIEIRDVTQKREDDGHRTLLSNALEHLPESVMLTDTAGVIRYVSPAFEVLTGYSSAEAIGLTPALLKSGRHGPEFYRDLWRTVSAGETWQGEFCNRKKSGELYFEQTLITPVRDRQGVVNYFLSTARDVTAQTLSTSELLDRAYRDAETGLASARHFREISQAILSVAHARGHGAALLRVDLNDLDLLNAYGAPGRAEVLRSFAERLQAAVAGNSVFGRAEDGAEFLVLLTNGSDVYEVTSVIQRIREGPGAEPDSGVEPLPGVIVAALYPQDATSFDDLYAQAGEALRRARDRGTRIEFANADLVPVSSDFIALERDFRWAAERHQFVLQYQPVFALAVPGQGPASGTERVPGITVRPRWPHLERGFIEHSQFRSFIEAAGRSIELDRWCLAGLIESAASWSEQGWPGWVALDLSADSLLDPELPVFIAGCLHQRCFPPHRLVIAIASGLVLPSDDQSLTVIHQLKAAGVRVALGGIGADSTSFANLRYLPADLVFLDSALVDGIGRDLRGEQILESLIGLIRRMGLSCVAPEVEDEIQLQWICEAGVELGQGPFLGQGGSPDAIKKLLF